MTTTESDFNTSIGRISTELEQVQYHLLMIKAANLAYNGCFNEASPDSYSRFSCSAEETAQYFISRFLELKPEETIEQAIDALYDLKNKLKQKPSQPPGNKTTGATIQISIGGD